MKDKINNFFKLTNEDIIMIVLAFMSFSFGIWTNYRQLWLQDIGYSVTSISRMLSIALICSALIIFIISFFSTKVNLKNIIMLSIVFRAVSLLLLAAFDSDMNIKAAILLCVMCENIFSVAFYPFLATVNKSNETYQKHVLINYFIKDFAVIFCGLLLGVTVGKIVFNYGTCLFLSLINTLFAAIVLLLFQENKETKKKNVLPFKKAFKNLFKSKVTNMYLVGQFITETSYSIVFGMTMLMLTVYLKFDVSVASIFIIICNLLGSITSSVLTRYGNKLTTSVSVWIKYGSRTLMYVIAFICNSVPVYVLTLIVAFITTRILDDKVNGVYIRSIRTDSQFLFGNIRYFVLCIADGVGVFLAGILLNISLSTLFIVSAALTLLGIFVYTFFCKKSNGWFK